MYTKENLQKVKQSLETAENIAILIHKNPDPDALGSASAMYQVLKKLGKKASIFSPSGPPDVFSFVPCFEQIQIFKGTSIPNAENYDLFLFLDGGILYRFADEGDLQIPDGVATLNFDHHPESTEFAGVTLISTEVSSTAEIIFDLMKFANWEVTAEIALAIMIGIVGDTGWFRFSNTSPVTFKNFAELLEINDCLVGLDYLLTHSKKSTWFPMWKIFMNNLQTMPEQSMLYTFIDYQDIQRLNFEWDDISSSYHYFLDDYMRSFKDVDVALIIIEKTLGVFKGSMRSELGTVDVGKVCAEFEIGGGHLNAAAFVTNKSKDEIMEIVHKGLKKQLVK